MTTRDRFRVELSGFKEMDAFFRELGARGGAKIMRDALRGPADELNAAIQSASVRMMKRRTGTLVQSIESKGRRSQKYRNVGFEIVGEYYGRFIDSGHKIVRESALGSTRIRQRGRRVDGSGRRAARYGKVVGYAPPIPFIRAPFEALRDRMSKQIASSLERELVRIWTKKTMKDRAIPRA